jgi:hypothetical protein
MLKETNERSKNNLRERSAKLNFNVEIYTSGPRVGEQQNLSYFVKFINLKRILKKLGLVCFRLSTPAFSVVVVFSHNMDLYRLFSSFFFLCLSLA